MSNLVGIRARVAVNSLIHLPVYDVRSDGFASFRGQLHETESGFVRASSILEAIAELRKAVER